MILIVDDKKEELLSLKTLLQLNSYKVDTATSGKYALEKLLKKEYELVILDEQIPVTDGYGITEDITGYSKSKDIPVLFISRENIDKHFIAKEYYSGVVDYISTPFDPELLLLKIKTFARLYQQTKELNDVKFNLEKKVAERTAELKKANKELEKSNAELQQYAFIASHDLQEPLRKIITFSHIVKERFVNRGNEAGQYMNRIISSSQRMRTLINGLLSYSKLSAIPVFVTTPLNSILQDTITDLELSIKETGAKLVIKQLPSIDIIPDQMRQVFQNIISNALKFLKQGTSPEIKIWSDFSTEKSTESKAVNTGKYCRIYISDKGIGFNEQYLNKIFTMFQRLHGMAEYEGTGIGLSIVKKIIEKHDGIVTAKSKENKGAVFILILPVKQTAKPVALAS